MFLEHMMNQTNAPLLERLLDFTSARQKLIAQNVANIDTPGYTQKDLDPEKFYALLRDRVDQNNAGNNARFSDVPSEVMDPQAGVLFHDGNNRSIEQLQSDQAKNMMVHNLVVELLRKQYAQLNMALSEKVS